VLGLKAVVEFPYGLEIGGAYAVRYLDCGHALYSIIIFVIHWQAVLRFRRAEDCDRFCATLPCETVGSNSEAHPVRSRGWRGEATEKAGSGRSGA